MKKYHALFSFLLLLNCNFLFSQNYLYVDNPNWFGSENEPASIVNADFIITPKGAYMEVGMVLTLSADDSNFPEEDLLELILDFTLPEGSIIYDSWLWMLDGETIVRADVLDYYSALETYEDIVDRQTDPSILYRKDNGNYQIRIYPIQIGQTRKIKISYLVPANWGKETVHAWIPTEILKTSFQPLSTFRIYTLEDSKWENPRIRGQENLDFTETTLPIGPAFAVKIPGEALDKPLNLVFDSPLKYDNVYFQSREEADHNFYQLAYFPPEIETSGKNVMFIVDHLEDASKITGKALYDHVTNICKEKLNSNDKFNLIFPSTENTYYLNYNWIPGDPISIEKEFQKFPDGFTSKSDLENSLSHAINFINEKDEDAEIILLSGSKIFNSSDQIKIKSLINDLMEDRLTPINVINYRTQENEIYFNWGNNLNYYQSNKSFLEEISRLTGGTYTGFFEASGNPFLDASTLMDDVLQEEEYYYDFHAQMDNGLLYNKYYQSAHGQSFNANRPIIEIGKFVGEGNISIQFSSLIDSEVIHENTFLEEEDILEADSLNREAWFGNHIRQLESLAFGENEIKKIIDLSIKERVLSKYTAYLALDLTEGGEPCVGCWDIEDGIFTAVDEVEESQDSDQDEKVESFTAGPNPFHDFCKISIILKEGQSTNNASLKIADALGNILLEKNITEDLKSGIFEFIWDGTNELGYAVPTGIYYVILNIDGHLKSLKLVKI